MRPAHRSYVLALSDEERRDLLLDVVEELAPDRHAALLDALDVVAPQLTERVIREHRRESGASQPPPPPSRTIAVEGWEISYAPSAQLPEGIGLDEMTDALLAAHRVADAALDKSDRVSIRCAGRLRRIGAIAQVRGRELRIISIDARRHRFQTLTTRTP